VFVVGAGGVVDRIVEARGGDHGAMIIERMVDREVVDMASDPPHVPNVVIAAVGLAVAVQERFEALDRRWSATDVVFPGDPQFEIAGRHGPSVPGSNP
jgi:hypothetical protein